MTLPALSNGIRSRPVFVPSGGRQRQGGMGRNNRRQDPAAKARKYPKKRWRRKRKTISRWGSLEGGWTATYSSLPLPEASDFVSAFSAEAASLR
jgi:hypothetical protein